MCSWTVWGPHRDSLQLPKVRERLSWASLWMLACCGNRVGDGTVSWPNRFPGRHPSSVRPIVRRTVSYRRLNQRRSKKKEKKKPKQNNEKHQGKNSCSEMTIRQSCLLLELLRENDCPFGSIDGRATPVAESEGWYRQREALSHAKLLHEWDPENTPET